MIAGILIYLGIGILLWMIFGVEENWLEFLFCAIAWPYLIVKLILG